uniref:Uncharacterized protein n=1 Tax=Ciona savignyi TaxID=51511 RepID=H2YXT1_CIOSA
MMQTYGPSDSIGSMYNGSQYMSASSQNPEQAPGMQGHTRLSLSSQPPSSYPGGETAPLRGGMPSYQQQRSAAVQYQMRPGMNSGTPVAPGSTAMYMHQAQQYPGQPGQRVPGPPQTSMYAPQHLTSSASIVAGSKHPGSAGQYDEASAQMAMSQQQSMQQQNQATMQGNAPAQMKPGAP